MRFESAMDAQRWTYSKLVADSKTKTPQRITPLKLEKEAADFCTLGIFYKFQEEVNGACFDCTLEGMSKDELECFTVKDKRKSNKTFNVSYNSNGDFVTCSCQIFSYQGYLCQHCIFILKLKGVESMPKTYF